ncbi:purine-binding chemotaxis protein CheW [Candidatus Magnetomoraceae bacterium gMMP-15]
MERDEIYDNDKLDDEKDEDTLKDRFLTFKIGDEDYGVELCYVTEIIGIQKITQVPEMPNYVKGVINLRGRVVPVLDVRIRFLIEPRGYDEETCVIVVTVSDTEVGLVVDTVNEVVTITDLQISPPPNLTKGDASRFIRGMGKINDEVKILLNINKLLYDRTD